MKVLGISGGREMGNSELLLRQALMGAKDAGAEVEMLRLNDFEIVCCVGCSACEKRLEGMINCIYKDDFPLLLDRIYEADGVILSTPIYTWAPSGNYRAIGDRIGPPHDVEMLRIKGMQKADSPIDQRIFKKRKAAFITVGGSRSPAGSSMGMAMMNQAIYPLGMDITAMLAVHGAYAPGQCVADPLNLEKAYELGAVFMTAPPVSEQMPTLPSQVCPNCKTNLLAYFPQDNEVVCANCAITGKMVVDSVGNFRAIFTEDDRRKSRFSRDVMHAHANEVIEALTDEAKRELEAGYIEHKQKYIRYKPYRIKPEKTLKQLW